MNQKENKKECENCKEVKVAELSERIVKLEKSVERQGKQDKQTKLMSKVIFYGAVASGFNAIFGFVSMIAHWTEKFKR